MEQEDQGGEIALSDEENEEVSIPKGDVKGKKDFNLCLVGTLATSSRINFLAFRDTLAAIWQPLAGIAISDLGERRFLFRFFHEVDISRVIEGSPWEFNRNLLLIHRLTDAESPLEVPLFWTNIWVQIHGLQSGLMSESLAKKFGDFIGEFLEHDTSQSGTFYRQYMRIRVKIDIRKPLKRKKKVKISESSSFFARFQYERLPLFCFICGKIGHGERFCPVRLHVPSVSKPYGWDNSIRAPLRRQSMLGSQWLRKDDGSPLYGVGFQATDEALGDLGDGSDMEIHEESSIEVTDGNKRPRQQARSMLNETGMAVIHKELGDKFGSNPKILAGAVVRPDQPQ